MATDIGVILANLTSFYDFTGKSVVHVGAGGGQLIGYASGARHVVAVDSDADAVAQLEKSILALGLADRVVVKQAAFEDFNGRADVVLFEFCLHEIADADTALAHARIMAPDTVVIDHAPDSPWTWYTAETEKVEDSWKAVERAGFRRTRKYGGKQEFQDVDALVRKIEFLGEPAIGRAKSVDISTLPIHIPMTYRLALL